MELTVDRNDWTVRYQTETTAVLFESSLVKERGCFTEFYAEIYWMIDRDINLSRKIVTVQRLHYSYLLNSINYNSMPINNNS